MKEHYCEYSRGTNNKLSTHDEANDKQLQLIVLKIRTVSVNFVEASIIEKSCIVYCVWSYCFTQF